MTPKLKEFFKGDKKYFTIVFFIVGLIIFSGIITPIYLHYQKNNWDTEVTELISRMEGSVIDLYKEKESYLLQYKNLLKDELEHTLSPHNTSYGRLIEVVNDKKYEKFSVEVVAPNGRIIAWNKDPAVPQENIFPLYFPAGEVYFYNADLMTHLTILDTIHLESDLFYFIISIPFEKKYNLQNEYYKEVSFINKISGLHLTQFEIEFNPYSRHSRDGRKYSFNLLNNYNNKIAVVTFLRPAVSVVENKTYGFISVLQSILAVIAFIVLAFGFRKEYNLLKSRLLRLLIFSAYLAGFRILLFFVEFPSRIIEGPLTDPNNFSSAFAWGIVKSPLDFFLTVLFFLFISIRAFSFLTEYISVSRKKIKSIFIYITALPVTAVLFFITLRGLNASLRSVIFDSSLRYFKDPDIIPDLTLLFILVTVLMLGTAVVLFLSSYLLFAFSTIPSEQKKKYDIFSVIILLVYIAVGYYYVVTQSHPLISIFLAFLFLALIWIFIYIIFLSGIRSVFNYVYASLLASLISITLLNYFNLELEKESLKTTATEINRPDESLIKFLISETLLNTLNNEELRLNFIRRNVNYDAVAFLIWSTSSLQRESLNSSVILYDTELQELGRFSAGITDEPEILELYNQLQESVPVIQLLKGKESSKYYYAGVIPVTDRGTITGFISALAEYDLESIALSGVPAFLKSQKQVFTSVVDINKLNIFRFQEGKLVDVYGDLYPSREQIKPILEAAAIENGEAWLSLSFNNEDYITYVQSTDDKITSVSLRQRHFSWRLFNFFKIFILHSLIILLLYVILYFTVIRKIRYSFRMQLLVAFLIISIFPVILLAFYNRQVVTERSNSAVISELNERAAYLQNHLEIQLRKHPERELDTAFKNAGEELTISFSIYDNSTLLYSSSGNYYNAGLFPEKIDPVVYYHLNYLSFREYITNERLDNFVYNSFYKKITIENRSYILGVNDAFNKINVSFASADFDVILFGVYSFAVLIIIIISTVLANKISAPVRKLTKATESVAHGDLNVRLQNTERGEIRDLLNGFNYMTEELQKNEIEMAQLERENAWKEMAKQVAHEIKNPLTPMKLAVQQLVIAFKDKNNNFEEIFNKVTSTLLNQVENLNQIASEFSRFARMPKFNLEEVDLVEAVNDTVNLFLDEQIKIKTIFETDNALVQSDKAQTRRMFINLIRNSIQAEAGEIIIRLFRKDESFIITFADNGKGIPGEVQQKIFDPNFTTKEKGMGIGLKISRRYLESIGGEIILKETTSEGTIFEIKIPA